jgi:hypothetical protein
LEPDKDSPEFTNARKPGTRDATLRPSPREQNPEKLMALVNEIPGLLREKDRRLGMDSIKAKS